MKTAPSSLIAVLRRLARTTPATTAVALAFSLSFTTSSAAELYQDQDHVVHLATPVDVIAARLVARGMLAPQSGPITSATIGDAHEALTWWRIALAFGPDYQTGIAADARLARAAARQALRLSANADAKTRLLATALAARYSDDPAVDECTLAQNYAAAMRRAFHISPDDADIAVAYVEATLGTAECNLYQADGYTSTAQARELLGLLDAVLQTHPEHVAAKRAMVHLRLEQNVNRFLAALR